MRSSHVTGKADPCPADTRVQLGGMCYIDLYAGNLQNIRDKIGYFKELGLTYLHLMPCSERRSASRCYGTMYSNSDERLGTLKDLAQLSKELHE